MEEFAIFKKKYQHYIPLTLHRIIQANRYDLFTLVINHPTIPCPFNEQDSYGVTPLFMTIMYARKEMFYDLLEDKESVSVNIADRNMMTPLHAACYYDRLWAVFELCARFDTHIEAKDRIGYTPLCICIMKCNLRCAFAIIHSGRQLHEEYLDITNYYFNMTGDENYQVLIASFLDKRSASVMRSS